MLTAVRVPEKERTAQEGLPKRKTALKVRIKVDSDEDEKMSGSRHKWRRFIQTKSFAKLCLNKRRVKLAQLTNVNDGIKRILRVWIEIRNKIMGWQ